MSFILKVFFSLALLGGIYICQPLSAQGLLQPVAGNLEIGAGIQQRKEDFRWSIAGTPEGKDPNILSELIFNPLYARGFYTAISYKFHPKLSLGVAYDHWSTYKGSATDYDYAEDNRTSPTVALHLNSNKGKSHTIRANAYYHLLNTKGFLVTPGIGYSTTKDLFYLLDGQDADLKTTYTARWSGPDVRLNARWTSKFNLYIDNAFSYHFFKYSAEANWNLIDEFEHPVSFIQNANGRGINYRAGLGYRFPKNITAAISWFHSNWRTDAGRDKLFLKSGEKPETRMNGAFKKNSGWQLSAAYTF